MWAGRVEAGGGDVVESGRLTVAAAGAWGRGGAAFSRLDGETDMRRAADW